MSLEDDVKEVGMMQQSELQGMARELFEDKFDDKQKQSSIDLKTNLVDEEVGLCMINDIIFSFIDLPELSPTKAFKRLASSRKGWKVESFVKAAQGSQDMRFGGAMMRRMGGMFGGRQMEPP